MALDNEFWNGLKDQAFRRTARVLYEIFDAGSLAGERVLPKRAQILVDWDVISQAAIDYLEIYRLHTVPGITQTIQDRATKVIRQWIESGEPLRDLTQRLDPVFGTARAKRIAVTEVTRTYAAGNTAAWKSTGLVTAKVWQTAVDERVCPICGPLHGKTVEIDGNFSLLGESLPPGFNPAEMIFIHPPAHPGCRCWLKPVVSEAALTDRIGRILG